MGRMRAVSRAGTSAPMMATPNTAAMPAAITPGEALAVTEVSSWLAPPNGPALAAGEAAAAGEPAAALAGGGRRRAVLELIRALAMPPLAKEATAAPTTLPRATRTRASSTNCRPMVRFGAPMAFRTPISRRRSRTSMTMISRMIRPAVPRAATKAMKEMFLTLSSELTAVSRLRWPWVTSALSEPSAVLQGRLGGVDVLHAVDRDDHGGQFAGQFGEGLGGGERHVEGVVAEGGAGVEQALRR